MSIPDWEEVKNTQTYRQSSPVEQAAMRDEWFNLAADEERVFGKAREEMYDKFILYQNKMSSYDNTGEPRPDSPEAKEFDERYSGVLGAAFHAFTQGNWLSKAALKADQYLYDEFGIEGGTLWKEQQRQKAAGWEYKPKTKAEERVHRVTEMIPDIAAMSPVGKGVSGLTRLGLSAIPKVAKYGKTIAAASAVTGGASAMGTVSGLKETIDPQIGSTSESIVEGVKAGGVGTAADIGLDAITNLVPQPARTIARIGKEIVSPVIQSGVNMLTMGEPSMEAFEEGIYDMAALHIATAPGRVHQSIKTKKAQAQIEYIEKAQEVFNTFDKAKAVERYNMNAEQKAKTADLVDIMADSISQGIAEKAALSTELVKTQEGRNVLEEYGAPDPVIEKVAAKRQILQTKYKKQPFIEAVEKIITNRLTPDQINNMGKAEVYHAFDRIFMGKIKQAELRKKVLLAKYAEGKKAESDTTALSKRISDTDIEIAQYKLFREEIKSDPLYDLTDPSFDFSEASTAKLIEMRNKLTGNIIEDKGWIETSKDFIKRDWINSFRDSIANRSKAGKAMMELVDRTVLEKDLLAGQWKTTLEPFRKMPPEYREAVRLILSRKNMKTFDQYAKERGYSEETRRGLIEAARAQRQVLDNVKDIVNNLGMHGFEEIKQGFFPRMMQERYLQKPKFREEFINDMISKGQVLEKIAGKGLVRKRGDVIEKVFKDDRGVKEWREYTMEERRKDIERFLGELRSANRERTYGHLQKERQFNWIPEKYLETDIYAVLNQYYDRAAQRIVEVRNYGDADEKLMSHLSQANMELANNPNVSNREHLSAMQDLQRAYKILTYQKSNDAIAQHVIDGWMALQVLRKMPLSAIGQTGQFFAPIGRAGKMAPWGKALMKNIYGGKAKFYNPETGKYEAKTMREISIECGSANTAIMNDLVARMVGDVNSVMSTHVQNMLSWNGFKKMDSLNRLQAASTGWFYAEDLMKRINRIANSPEAMKMSNDELITLFQKKGIFNKEVTKDKFAKRRLEQLDLSLETILKRGRSEDGKFHLTKGERLTAARKFEIDTNFRASEFDLPKQFTKTGAGKMVTQFNTYNYSRTKEIKNFVFKEAMAGNVAPLLWTLGMAGIVGTGIEGIRCLLTGKEMPDDMKEWAYEALSNFGALGYFSNFYGAVDHGSQILGATAEDLWRLVKMLGAMSNSGSIDPLIIGAVRQMPYLGWLGKRIVREQKEEDKRLKAAERARNKNAFGKGFKGFSGGFDKGF